MIEFLLVVVSKIRSLMNQLMEAGLFPGVRRPPVALTVANPFTKDDLSRLIAAANQLVKSSA